MHAVHAHINKRISTALFLELFCHSNENLRRCFLDPQEPKNVTATTVSITQLMVNFSYEQNTTITQCSEFLVEYVDRSSSHTGNTTITYQPGEFLDSVSIILDNLLSDNFYNISVRAVAVINNVQEESSPVYDTACTRKCLVTSIIAVKECLAIKLLVLLL